MFHQAFRQAASKNDRPFAWFIHLNSKLLAVMARHLTCPMLAALLQLVRRVPKED